MVHELCKVDVHCAIGQKLRFVFQIRGTMTSPEDVCFRHRFQNAPMTDAALKHRASFTPGLTTTIDKVFRFMFPFAYFLFLAAYFTHYLN